MKKLIFPLSLACLSLMMHSCYKPGPDLDWDRRSDDTSNISTDPDPVVITVNGEELEFDFTGALTDAKDPAGKSVDMKCANNDPEKCGAGGLADPESVSKSFDDLYEDALHALDVDGDGEMDMLDSITESVSGEVASDVAGEVSATILDSIVDDPDLGSAATGSASAVATVVDKDYPGASVDEVDLLADINLAIKETFSGNGAIQMAGDINSAVDTIVRKTINKVLNENKAFLEEEVLFEAIQEEVAVAVQDVVQAAVEDAIKEAVIASLTENSTGLTSSEIELIASQVAADKSQNIAGELIAEITEEQASVVQSSVSEVIFELSDEPAYVQGACPEGHHIPSDYEMKQLELGLGMSSLDVHKSGIYADRGADADMANMFKETLALSYPGYMTEDGKFAQYGEVDIILTSSAGKDSLGTYVWIRYVDKMEHDGVIRKKLRKKTRTPFRCLKD